MQKASDLDTELGLSLGRAYPISLDDSGVLTVEFEPGADKGYAILQSPEKIGRFESLLQEKTDNIVKVQIRKAPPPPPPPEETTVAEQEPPMELREVPAENYDDLLREDGIAVVVKEFRGAIVAVQGTQKQKRK